MKLIGNPLIYFRLKMFLFKERKQIKQNFPQFLPYQKAFDRAYRFINPFRVCKSYLKQKKEKETDAYGETALPALAKIAEECRLNSADVLLEMGCGRGLGAFFLSYLVGCTVIGVDFVPYFIKKAKVIQTITPALPVHFRCEDMLNTEIVGCTVIYLFGTCLADDIIEKLIQRFMNLPSSTKIITVSYSLSDYSSKFQTIKQFSVEFPWGETDVYLNQLYPFQ